MAIGDSSQDGLMNSLKYLLSCYFAVCRLSKYVAFKRLTPSRCDAVSQCPLELQLCLEHCWVHFVC